MATSDGYVCCVCGDPTDGWKSVVCDGCWGYVCDEHRQEHVTDDDELTYCTTCARKRGLEDEGTDWDAIEDG